VPNRGRRPFPGSARCISAANRHFRLERGGLAEPLPQRAPTGFVVVLILRSRFDSRWWTRLARLRGQVASYSLVLSMNRRAPADTFDMGRNDSRSCLDSTGCKPYKFQHQSVAIPFGRLNVKRFAVLVLILGQLWLASPLCCCALKATLRAPRVCRARAFADLPAETTRHRTAVCRNATAIAVVLS